MMESMVSFKWDENRAREITVEEAEARGEARGEALGEAQGEARGKHDAIVQIVLSAIKKKYSIHTTSDLTGLSPEEIEKIAKDHGLAF